MAVINPHTTRATGTVLTAAIYNADHQNHITNALNLNADILSLASIGTVTGIVVNNGAGVYSGRSILNVVNQTAVTNGDGTVGDITVGLATNPTLPGNTTVTGSLLVQGGVQLSPVGANVLISPTTTGLVTINPNTAGSMNNMTVGNAVPKNGTFLVLASNSAAVVGAITAGGNISAAGVLSAGDGTAALPGMKFAGAQTGMFRTSLGGLGFTIAGVEEARFGSTFFSVGLAGAVDPTGPSAGAGLYNSGQFASYMVAGGGQINLQMGQNNAAFTSTNYVRVGTSVGSVSHTAGLTAFNTTSDEREKEFVGFFPVEDAYRIIRADPVWEYIWKNLPEKTFDIGWGAQTSHKIAERLATPGVPARGRKGQKDYQPAIPWGMDHSKRIPYIWTAVRDMMDRLDALEA